MVRAVLKHRVSRHWQPVTTFALMALQVHLLVVPVLHHHGAEVLASGAAAVRAENHGSQPASDRRTDCPACHIVRHSAVRPTLSSPIVEVSFAAPLPREFALSRYHSLHSEAVFGRAPPLP